MSPVPEMASPTSSQILAAEASISTLLIESSADGILAFDQQCRYTIWNAAMEQISGLPREQVLGRCAFEVFPFIQETGGDRFFYAALAGESIECHDQHFVIPSTGKEGIFDGRYSPLRDAHGTVIGGLAIIHDATARKRAEQQARSEAEAAERRFRTTFEQSPLSKQILAPDGRTLRVNQAWEKLWGLTMEDLTNYNVLADQQLIDKGLMPYIESGFAGEPTTIPAILYSPQETLHTGLARWVRGFIYPLKDDSGHVTEVVLVHEDISDRKAVEDLHQRQARQESLRADVGAAFKLAAPLQSALQLCTEAIVRHLDVAVAQVWKLEPGQNVLELQASAGMDIDALGTLSRVSIGESAIGIVAQNRQVYLSNELANDALLQAEEWTRQAGLISFAGYPLLVQGHLAGVLAIYSRYLFDDNVVRTHSLVVDNVAQGIQGYAIEASLRDSERRYRSLFETNPAPIGVLRADSLQFLTVNQAAVEHYGYSREEFATKSLYDIQSSGEIVDLFAERKYQLPARTFTQHRLKDGSLIDVEMTVEEIEYQGQAAYVIILNDVTSEKQFETGQRFLAETGAALVSSLDYDITLKTVASLVIPFLADWCIIDLVEGESIRRVAVSASDPQKHEFLLDLQRRYAPTWDSPQPAMHALREKQPVFYKDIDAASLAELVRDSEHFQLMQQLAPRNALAIPLIAREHVVGVITLAMSESGRSYRDFERTLAEEVARRAALAIDNARLYHEVEHASRMKDEFLAVLSHELRTPLTAILGWSNLLQAHRLDEETVQAALSSIEKNAKSQSQLVDDLLEVSRIITDKFQVDLQECDFTSVIKNSVETTRFSAATKQIELSLDCPPIPCRVWGDPYRLQQVALNLLSNSIKFTPPNGRIEVVVQDRDTLVELRVSDSGQGITAEVLPHIFDRFRQSDGTTTRQFGGLGLGLSIVKHIVDLHNGTIEAYSAGEGLGASFTVQLAKVLPENAAIEKLSSSD